MSDEAIVFEYTDGDVIFLQNDPGGDLYLIESGIVEIYREKEGVHVTLSEMNPGEIIGLLTCLDRRPRTASAKAKGPVKVKKIQSARIQNTLHDLPKWVQIILKEFTIRIQENLNMLIEQSKVLEDVKHSQIDMTYEAQLLCATLSSLAPYHKESTDRGDVVFLPSILEQAADCLCMPENKIKRIIDILHDSGLIKMEKDPDKKQMVVPYKILTAVVDFSQFVTDSRHGLARKQVRHHYKSKSIRNARAIVMYAQKKGFDAGKTVKFTYPELEASLEKVTGTAFIADSLEELAPLKLLEVADEEISFVPRTLGRSIAKIAAIHKLQGYKEERPH